MAFSKSPNHVDLVVGQRLRWRRRELRLTQEQLGDRLGLTFQQVQKYERGANRVSASRLWDISQILDVKISYFFEDMTDDTMKASPRRMSRGSDVNVEEQEVRDPMARRETLELVRTYYSIERPRVRKRIADMIKSIAQTINEK